MYPFQNSLFLLLFEIVLFDSVGLMEKLQLGWICLEVNFRSLLIGFPSKNCGRDAQNNARPTSRVWSPFVTSGNEKFLYELTNQNCSRCVWAMEMVSPE